MLWGGILMSIIFKDYNEMKKHNTVFIEIQYCKLRASKSIKKKVAVRNMKYRLLDSLYIHSSDIEKFYDEYGEIFVDGTYNNQKTGFIDPYGINYFQKNQINDFINHMLESKPTDYKIMIEWLKQALEFNGFYILGI